MGNNWQEQVDEQVRKLGWDETDELKIKVGGSVVSGIHQSDNANPKWTLPFGERRYNNDAFIVIENLTRQENK